jgi:hypothetical protein
VRTRRESRVALRLAGAALFFGALAGCRKAEPPFGTFDVTLQLPPKAGQPAPTPPEAALRPWRVWINQELPRQKKNPEWRPYAAKEGALLDVAMDGKWRCLMTPVQLFATFDDHRKVAEWVASRNVRCSSDGWKTHVETLVRSRFAPDGTPTTSDPPGAMYLSDVVDRQPRSTVVVLEPLVGYHRERPRDD